MTERDSKDEGKNKVINLRSRAPYYSPDLIPPIPHNVLVALENMEKIIIGVSITSGYPVALDRITFYSCEEHREIAKAIATMYQEVGTVDIPGILERLRENDVDRYRKLLLEILEMASAVRGDEDFIRSSLNSILTAHQMVQGYYEMYRFMIWLNSAPRSLSEAHEELLRTVDKIREKQLSFRDTITMNDAADKFESFLGNKDKVYCSTGIKKLDAILCGFRPNMLYVIGGRPGMGKTALGVTALKEAMNSGRKVLFVTMEMPARDLFARIVSQETNIPLWRLVTGRLTAHEEEVVKMAIARLKKLKASNDVIFAENCNTDGDIIRIVRNHSPDIVIVDYLQLCRSSYMDRIERRDIEIGLITRHLKKLAMEQGIPVVLMSQLNRKIEDRFYKLPQLSDLRESRNIEQDADVIIFVCRARPEEIEDEEISASLQRGKSSKKKAETAPPPSKDVYPGWIVVAKNRNGPTCTIDTWFVGSTAQYVDKDDLDSVNL